MATYTNAGNDNSIHDDITNPTLGATDIVNILKGDMDYDQVLGGLGTTAFAEFNTGKGFSGNLGDYPSGLLCAADIIRLGDSGRKHALKSSGGLTCDLLEFKCRHSAELTLHDFDTITQLNLLSPGKVTAQDTAIVTNAVLGDGGLTALFEAAGTALTLVTVSPKRGSATAIIERDATTVTIKAGGIAEAREACSPATVNNDAGTYKHASSGALTAINAGAGAEFDFSEAVGDSSSIAWTISGDITIVEPPEGVTIDMPTPAEQSSFRITYKPAA